MCVCVHSYEGKQLTYNDIPQQPSTLSFEKEKKEKKKKTSHLDLRFINYANPASPRDPLVCTCPVVGLKLVPPYSVFSMDTRYRMNCFILVLQAFYGLNYLLIAVLKLFLNSLHFQFCVFFWTRFPRSPMTSPEL